MRKLTLFAFILGAWMSIYATEASAAVCARGMSGAACVGPRGAVMGHRTMGGRTVIRGTRIYPRAGVITHRRTAFYPRGRTVVQRRTVIR